MIGDDRRARFKSAFVNSGGLCDVECECGRIHFVSGRGHGDYNEGELDRLKRAAKIEPKKYIEHDLGESIDIAWLHGRQYVADCDCDYAGRIACFLEDHAEPIAKYLKLFVRDRRLDRAREEAIDQRIEGNVEGVGENE